jgi:hypothetical protein
MSPEETKKTLAKFEKARQERLRMLQVTEETLGKYHELVREQRLNLKALEKTMAKLNLTQVGETYV